MLAMCAWVKADLRSVPKGSHAVPYKRFVQIGEGTHSVMTEKNRMQLFQAVQQFLDESFTLGQ